MDLGVRQAWQQAKCSRKHGGSAGMEGSVCSMSNPSVCLPMPGVGELGWACACVYEAYPSNTHPRRRDEEMNVAFFKKF